MRLITLILSLVVITMTTAIAAEKIVVAHRGASGYLPEHTMPAKAMAYAMGPDYIEQDVVMTKDDRLVVLHDHFLDQVTDVQEKFPNRKRADGRYYVIDFTLAEILTLNVLERFHIDETGKKVAYFPGRFPLGKSIFKVHTLEDEIEMIQGLNKSTGQNIGIYTESKSAAFHLSEGKDLSKAILQAFKKYGYDSKNSNAYYQTFEYDDLKRVHDELLPELDMDIKLVQLMGEEEEYNDLITRDGLKALSKYADGIGPSISMITKADKSAEGYHITDLVKDAHDAGLVVHPYTFRAERFAMPKFVGSFDELLDLFYNKIGVDGLFSDFPDRAVRFLHKK
ncbi:MAG: glycerophosphodiester phosphodiesterase [Kordiimonadaceae bacterium]|nr:glycerophosphodiester phosphodiesterase [Kordiimonadaceae bacterium]